MPKNLIEQLEQEYLAQQMRDIVGNRLTLALTILSHLRDGKRVNRRLINRAILDLKSIVRNPLTEYCRQFLQGILEGKDVHVTLSETAFSPINKINLGLRVIF